MQESIRQALQAGIRPICAHSVFHDRTVVRLKLLKVSKFFLQCKIFLDTSNLGPHQFHTVVRIATVVVFSATYAFITFYNYIFYHRMQQYVILQCGAKLIVS